MLLGVDGGSAKMTAWLVQTDGTLVNRNVVLCEDRKGVDEGEARQLLKDLLIGLLSAHGGLSLPLKAVYAGMSTFGNPETARKTEAFLIRTLPKAQAIQTRADTFNPLYSLEGVRNGITAVAGATAAAIACVGASAHRVGGWGPLIDDAGSSYDIGRRVLKAALRQWDGRGDATLLTELITEKLEGKPLQEALSGICKGGRESVAAFAPLAFDAAAQGDRVGRLIVLYAEDAMALMIKTASGKLPIENGPHLVALCGKLWRIERFTQQVQERLGQDFNLRFPDLPQVAGCVAAAAEMAGCSGAGILTQLRKSVNAEGDAE